LCSALSACALSVIGMSAKKMDIDASGCWAEVTDVEEDTKTYEVTRIDITFHLKAEFEPSVRTRLEAYSHKACFVGNTLKAEKNFTFVYE
ncbi:MAG: OsmC family protein, partial [Prevotella sp.]